MTTHYKIRQAIFFLTAGTLVWFAHTPPATAQNSLPSCESCVQNNQVYCIDTVAGTRYCALPNSVETRYPNVYCRSSCITPTPLPPVTCESCISSGKLYCTVVDSGDHFCQIPGVLVYPDVVSDCQNSCTTSPTISPTGVVSVPSPTETPTPTSGPNPTPTPTATPGPPTPIPTSGPGTSIIILTTTLFGSDYTTSPRGGLTGSVELQNGTNVVRTLLDVPFIQKLQSAPIRTYQGTLVSIPFSTYKVRVRLNGYLSRTSAEITTGTQLEDMVDLTSQCRDKNSCVVAGDLTDDDLIDIADFTNIVDLVRRDFCDQREKGAACPASEANINRDDNVDIFDFQTEVNLIRENRDVHGDNRAPGLVGN